MGRLRFHKLGAGCTKIRKGLLVLPLSHVRTYVSCLLYLQVAIRFRPTKGQQQAAVLSAPARRGSIVRDIRASFVGLFQGAQDEIGWKIQETGLNASSVLGSTFSVTEKDVPRTIPGRNSFAMDAVFEALEDTWTVYNHMVKPIVLSAANGQHGTVFAYGQTGSGKTFTMQGDGDVDPSNNSPSAPKGVIQLAAADLFDVIKAETSRQWSVRASFIEIYNEDVRDLLDDKSSSSSSSHLTIREDSTGNVRMDAHQQVLTSVDDLVHALHKGNARRACASTEKNSRSSRSHAIFQVTIESCGVNGKRSATLNLVDLAGSEGAGSNSGARRREGGKINQSLLALTRVIQSLGLPDKKRPKHISYRDSKLTRILKPSLQGEACMAILCCASPAKTDLEETRSTLKFASSAKLIKINPSVNEVAPSTPDGKLQMELATVKKELSALQVKYRQLEIESSQRALMEPETPHDAVDIPVWYYAVAIIMCAFEMNRALLLALIVLMLSQGFSRADWAKLVKGHIP